VTAAAGTAGALDPGPAVGGPDAAGAGDGALDVAAARARFPALRRVHAGRPVAHFDGPGGTQVPQEVADAVAGYLLHHNATARWAFPTSEETDAVVEGARAAAADLLGARPDEVAFGANMTTLAFHLSRALGRRMPAGPAAGRPLGPGDEVVVTELDHHGNVAPWTALAREHGVTVRTARMHPDTCELDWEDLARLVGPRTRLLAVGAAANAVGTVTDVARAAGLARHVGALTFVDAVHWAPHASIDVARLARAGVDFLACSAYKFHGPHVGILWGRPELVAALDVPRVAPSSDAVPDRLETGTKNFEGLAGTRAAVDFLASLGDAPLGDAPLGDAPLGDVPGASAEPRRARLARAYRRLEAHERDLARRLWDGLRSVPGVTVYGPPPGRPRTPTVSFTVAGRRPVDVARHLAGRAVFASHGNFYAATVVERLGVPDGLVRAGAACYTTRDEVDRLVAGVAEAAGGGSTLP
jgi:cysteine desulfurase family protein (TIGR01976 family)